MFCPLSFQAERLCLPPAPPTYTLGETHYCSPRPRIPDPTTQWNQDVTLPSVGKDGIKGLCHNHPLA